jgi:anthranilate synthase component 2
LKIVVIDNYDSFTYNLVQRFGEIDSSLDIIVFRNDQVTLDAIEAESPTHLVISPGPCTPSEAGISVECVRRFGGKVPLLGVCLGHQSIGQAYGARIVRADRPMHGKTDYIYHSGTGLFLDVPSPMVATRYHSLVIDPPTLSEEFVVCGWSSGDDKQRVIMAIQHHRFSIFGVQFHPESFLCEQGTHLLKNFLQVTTAQVS